MFESSEILIVIDNDALTAVDRADDLSVAGDDAYTCPVEHSPHAPGRGVVADGLIGQFHVRGHTPRHRHAQDTTLYKPGPFARLVDRVLQSYLILSV